MSRTARQMVIGVGRGGVPLDGKRCCLRHRRVTLDSSPIAVFCSWCAAAESKSNSGLDAAARLVPVETERSIE
jgi:hypothetical protein